MNSQADTVIPLPKDPASVRLAREALRAIAQDSTLPRHDLELVASELITNAIEHGEAPIELRVRQRTGVILVEVCDGSSRHPTQGTPRPTDSRGRGLLIVSKLATSWGTVGRADGKCVWAAFSHDRS